MISGNVQIAKKNKEKYQLEMEVYKQTKEEEAMSLKKEEEEMMKLQKQEAMQMLKKKEKTENIIKVHFFSFIIVEEPEPEEEAEF